MAYEDIGILPSAINSAEDAANYIEFADGMNVVVLGSIIISLQSAWQKTLNEDRTGVMSAILSRDPALLAQAQEKYQEDSAKKDTVVQNMQTMIENGKQKVNQDSDNMTNVFSLESTVDQYMDILKHLISAGIK